MQPIIEDGALVLFQGDSITDAGRDRQADGDLGRGYAQMAAAWFSVLYPEKNVRFRNRGVGGNRVKDLKARWREDCLDLKPDWVSIMIGINDTWRRYDSDAPTTCEAYEADYRHILTRVRDEPGAKLILIEPFALPTPPDRLEWRVDLDPKIQAARGLSREFDAVHVSMDGIFAAACSRATADFWAPDGVHPTPAGHALIARSWLKAVRAI